MITKELSRDFSLLGGPLHRLGVRLGLVRGTNTVALGLAIGLSLWVVMIALAFVGGVGRNVFTLSLIGAHVRLLLVIPLMFVCESVVDPRMTSFARSLVSRGIVPDNQVAALDSLIARTCRWKNSWLAEALFLLVAILVALGVSSLDSTGTTAGFVPGRVVAGGGLAAWWYWAVGLTVFRFLFVRMIWRIVLWSYLLWRVSRLDLRLMPMHPDGVGGLGSLESAQMHFVPLILGFSILRSAQLAEEISSGTMAFEGIFTEIAAVLVLNAIVFLGPLLVFSPKLWMTRIKGLGDYMALATDYVKQFDQKWVQEKAHSEPLLGTADVQSLADLSNSVAIVRNMRWVTISPALLTSIGMAVMLPMLPLVLFKFPVTEIARKLVTGLVGL